MKRRTAKLKILLAILVTIFITNYVSAQKPTIEWVVIPAGTFRMGSPATEANREANEIQHQVTLSAFKMSKYEITVGQFKAFRDSTKRITAGTYNSVTGRLVEPWEMDIDEKPYPLDIPVTNVSWKDAAAFAEWMGCRLPTEAEWEYACRGGAKNSTPFNTGNNLTSSQANFNGNFPYNNNAKSDYVAKLLPAGSFPANSFGLCEMHGNALEWCSDWYGDYSSETETNPKGPLSGEYHIYRGGSWFSHAVYCRSAFRNGGDTKLYQADLGFRIVSDK
jgi:formylglycine-generating enzyme required for sulfatase activity